MVSFKIFALVLRHIEHMYVFVRNTIYTETFHLQLVIVARLFDIQIQSYVFKTLLLLYSMQTDLHARHLICQKAAYKTVYIAMPIKMQKRIFSGRPLIMGLLCDGKPFCILSKNSNLQYISITCKHSITMCTYLSTYTEHLLFTLMLCMSHPDNIYFR